MSLDLVDSLEVKVDHLDAAGLVVLGNTREQSSASVEHLDLGNVDPGLVIGDEFSLVDSFDSLIDSRGVNQRFLDRMASNACELEVLKHVGVLGVDILGIIGVSEEFPDEHVAVPTSRDEAGVVVHPVEAPHGSQVSLVHHLGVGLSGVELVNDNIALGSASEEVASI